MTEEEQLWDGPHAEFLSKLWKHPDKVGGRHWEIVQRISTLIEKGSVLDAGCGLGHLYGRLKDKDEYDYYAVDASQHMLDQAIKYYPEIEDRSKVANLRDLSTLARFDTVVSVDVVIHIADPIEPVMRQLWQKADHQLIFSVRLGKKSLVRKTFRYYKDPARKKVWLRIDTPETYWDIFARLQNLSTVEYIYFDPRTSIFKLTRGVKRPKPRDYNAWSILKDTFFEK